MFEGSVHSSGWWILTSWDTHAKSQPRKQTWKLSLIHVTLCGEHLCNYPRTAHRLISSLTCTMIKASKALSIVDEQSPQAHLLRWSKLTIHFLLIWKFWLVSKIKVSFQQFFTEWVETNCCDDNCSIHNCGKRMYLCLEELWFVTG